MAHHGTLRHVPARPRARPGAARAVPSLGATILLTAALLGPATAPLSAQAPGPATDRLTGRWEGAFGSGLDLTAFAVTLTPSAAGWSATFDLPAEDVVGFPLTRVLVAGDSLVLTLREGDAVIVARAVVAGDSIAGVIRLPHGEQALVLARAGSPVALRIERDLARALAAARDRPLEAVRLGAARERLDQEALGRLLRAAEAANSDAVVVLHDGELVGAWYARGRVRPIEAMSATKSIVSLAVGRLLTQGMLTSIDTPVHAFFPEWSDGSKGRVTIRHLLNHTSGLHADRTTEAIYASPDFVRHALDSEVTTEPGTAVFYNNSATNLLAGIIGGAAGMPMDDYLRAELFPHLGITDVGWTRDQAGNPHGMAGLQILPEDLARLGQLVLDRGRVGEQQIIDESWFDEALAPGSDLSHGVGLLWWLIRDPAPAGHDGPGPIAGYRADGYLGQYLVIYPAERLVAVRMVAASAAYDPETDGFADFQRLVRGLVPPAAAFDAESS
jgi:CubicO group peptidase (beta-lactamase class C family)